MSEEKRKVSMTDGVEVEITKYEYGLQLRFLGCDGQEDKEVPCLSGQEEAFLHSFNEAESSGKERFSFATFLAICPEVQKQFEMLKEELEQAEDPEYMERQIFLFKSRWAFQYYLKKTDVRSISEFVKTLDLKAGPDRDDPEKGDRIG